MQMPRCCYGLILLMGMTFSGCSSFSEWYACGVDCQYHPRPPLPYQHYEECVCHSHVVNLPRQSRWQQPEAETNDSDGGNNKEAGDQKDEKANEKADPDLK